jgi:hypothetical protein
MPSRTESVLFPAPGSNATVERGPPPACVFYSCSIGLIEVSDLLLLARERSRSEFLEVLDNIDDDYQK